ncbi:MAG: zinc ribbon domain-containing protein [Clostridiales bacterium]|nr:zinc ribbon domain-containing protein [Clostridiales bacterium]
MFCKNCGTQMNDNAAFCPNCGAAANGQPAQPAQPAQPQTQNNPVAQEGNTIAIVGFIFSFLIALVGLICSIVGYNNAKKGAPYKGLALAGMIISIVSMVLALIMTIVIYSNYAAWFGSIYGF